MFMQISIEEKLLSRFVDTWIIGKFMIDEFKHKTFTKLSIETKTKCYFS